MLQRKTHREILRNILEEGSWGVRGRRMDFFTGKRRGQSRENGRVITNVECMSPVTNEDWLSTEKWIMGAGLNLEFFSLRDG